MANKTYAPSEYKAIPALGLTITDEDKGIVQHLISVFGVTDLGGDVCHPGAFTKTLQERADRIRVLDAHQRNSVLNAIGVPLQLKEVSREELPAKVLEQWPEATGGLWAETQFLLDTPEGKGAFARIKAGAVKEFSFGYNTLDADFTEDSYGIETRHLRTIKLWEYGPVLFGMNPAAQVTGVKETAPPPPPPVSKGVENKVTILVLGEQEEAVRAFIKSLNKNLSAEQLLKLVEVEVEQFELALEVGPQS